MPRTLILMRHARQSTLAARDHDRPLTDAGRDDARRVGETLAREEAWPDLALSSTAQRCRETWLAVSSAFPGPVEARFEPDLYNASSRELLSVLAAADEEAGCVLLLAHNPGISVLALELAGSDDRAAASLRAGFSPATTARFEIEGAWSAVAPRTARFLRFDPV